MIFAAAGAETPEEQRREQNEIRDMLRHRLVAIDDALSIARPGWRVPTCRALRLSSCWSEADHTNTSLASAYVFDATATRELHSRPQNQIATPLTIAYRSSTLAHTVILLGLLDCPQTETVYRELCYCVVAGKRLSAQLHLGSKQRSEVPVSCDHGERRQRNWSGQDGQVEQVFKPGAMQHVPGRTEIQTQDWCGRCKR
jgi:hypothetical protein